MKKFAFALALIFTAVLVFSSCDTQHKCAAYGHYSEVITVDEQNNQL
ncbi:MAG: hypothetical protein J5644_06795 [Bacteroidales bacterium]|nr:hypothetical protein [Bacteroidales bacterium]